ncbi:MarR family transcriptional regulator (plasmid) [Azospirillum brasilense]|uniref:MarR family transcriptional regulator n=1 Tax=Azospirillum brasilense TaxID=192 RepID=A0A4D8RMP6_AZOBR|nr:MarR family transcriptional regulator [Azospirillum brasilense]QCO18232.1 MarR family transcriptional regulator [Azospirillum brasilense]
MVESSLSPLDAHLGYWLRFVSNHVSQAFAAKLAGRGVTVAEWVVLRDLHDRDGVAPSLLADRLGMTRGAISKLADRLAAKGLLTQTADPDDRRYQTLALTPEGQALVPDLSTLADRNDAEFFGHLDPAERRRIEDALKGIVRRMGLRSVPID